jgi:hypothetical protein
LINNVSFALAFADSHISLVIRKMLDFVKSATMELKI